MIDYSRLPRPQVEQAVIRMSFDDREAAVRMTAIRVVNDYNDIATAKLSGSAFSAAIVSMTSKLEVAVPAVPANLAALSDGDLVALAEQMQLAERDYSDRQDSLEQNHRHWATLVAAGTPAPTANAYLATLLTMMNYVREARGLAPVT